jgi:putative copper export protein
MMIDGPDALSVALRAVSFALLLNAAGIPIFIAAFDHLVPNSLPDVKKLGSKIAIAALLLLTAHQALEASRMAGEMSGIADPAMQKMAFLSPAGATFVTRILGLMLIIAGMRRAPSLTGTDAPSGTDALTGAAAPSRTDALTGADALNGVAAPSGTDALTDAAALNGVAAPSGTNALKDAAALIGAAAPSGTNALTGAAAPSGTDALTGAAAPSGTDALTGAAAPSGTDALTGAHAPSGANGTTARSATPPPFATQSPHGNAIALPGTLVLITSFTLMGHTATNTHRAVAAALITLHLLVVAFWLGALGPLYLAAQKEPPAKAGHLIDRFSAAATWAVPLILLAGIALSTLLLPSLAAFKQPYGQLLLAKLAGFAVLMAMAFMNKYLFGPACTEGNTVAFKRTVVIEYALICAVLAATAVMTTFFSPEPP